MKPHSPFAYVPYKAKEQRFNLNALAPTKWMARKKAEHFDDCDSWDWLYRRGWRIVRVEITEKRHG